VSRQPPGARCHSEDSIGHLQLRRCARGRHAEQWVRRPDVVGFDLGGHEAGMYVCNTIIDTIILNKYNNDAYTYDTCDTRPLEALRTRRTSWKRWTGVHVYCVLCTMYYVLCTVYYVLCTVYCVLCTVYCVLTSLPPIHTHTHTHTQLRCHHLYTCSALPGHVHHLRYATCIICIGVVSVFIQYNCVNYCDTLCQLL
jgi:hypothetical protein